MVLLTLPVPKTLAWFLYCPALPHSPSLATIVLWTTNPHTFPPLETTLLVASLGSLARSASALPTPFTPSPPLPRPAVATILTELPNFDTAATPLPHNSATAAVLEVARLPTPWAQSSSAPYPEATDEDAPLKVELMARPAAAVEFWMEVLMGVHSALGREMCAL